MNRRNFIRSGLAALISVAALPKIPLVSPSTPLTPIWPTPLWISSCSGGKITYEMLNRAYHQLCAGANLQPDLMVVSRYHANFIAKIYECEQNVSNSRSK